MTRQEQQDAVLCGHGFVFVHVEGTEAIYVRQCRTNAEAQAWVAVLSAQGINARALGFRAAAAITYDPFAMRGETV